MQRPQKVFAHFNYNFRCIRWLFFVKLKKHKQIFFNKAIHLLFKMNIWSWTLLIVEYTRMTNYTSGYSAWTRV